MAPRAVQLFFASCGASGNLLSVLKNSPLYLVFSTVQILTHFIVVLIAGRIFNIDARKGLVASNACVGGPTTAAGFAEAKGWTDLAVPGLMVGIVGYSCGTFIG